MSWQVSLPAQLTDVEWGSWTEILEQNPALCSPFFRPEYIQCVGKVLPIEIAVLRRDGKPLAFFPFERTNRSQAGAPGRTFADYQGVIHRPDTIFDVREMLSAASLIQWRFDHLLLTHPDFVRWSWTQWNSPQIDLSRGIEDYFDDLYTRHPNLKGLKKSERRVSRDIGQIRLEFGSLDKSLLDLMLNWKAAQYEATQRSHPFAESWVRPLLETALNCSGTDFSGRLAVLWAGSEPLAIEYSLQSRHTLHTLVSAYNIEHSKHSPGMLRDLHLIESSSQHGIKTIDMGKGLEGYKQKLMNAASTLCEGAIDTNYLRNGLRSCFHRSRYRFLRSSWSTPIKRIARSAANVFPSIRRLLFMR